MFTFYERISKRRRRKGKMPTARKIRIVNKDERGHGLLCDMGLKTFILFF